jgi:lambda repressor-like predicted transcriptional regulator
MKKPRASSTVVIDRAGLRAALARRGWSMRVLVAQAHIGTGSLAAINDGRPVNARILSKIAEALATHPELPGVDQLLADLSDRP